MIEKIGKKEALIILITAVLGAFAQKIFFDLSYRTAILFILVLVLIVLPILDFKRSISQIKNSRGVLIYFLVLLPLVTYLVYQAMPTIGYTINISRVKGKTVQNNETDELNSSSGAENHPGSPENQTTSTCSSIDNVFCSDFSNISNDFDKLDDFTQDSLNPRILRTNLPIKGDQDNAILWVKDKTFGPQLNFSLITKLHHKTQGNLTIVYGKDWRCIIGEKDHNKVACESEYDKKNNPRQQQYLTSIDKPPIPPDTELTIKGSVTLSIDNNFNIQLILSYFDSSGNHVNAELNFKVKYTSSDIENSRKRFGVGIIDPEDEGIKIEFIKLEL